MDPPHFARDGLRRFFEANPLLYGNAPEEELDQLAVIHALYPESARLLSDREAVELPGFECRRCGRCCSSVRYVTVCHGDARRWAAEGRADIFRSLVVDRRRTPLLAARRDAIAEAKAGARELMARAGMDDAHVFEVLYITGVLECAVYVKRPGGACAFLREAEGRASCGIQDTKPRVCDKFPYYMGRFTDPRLLKEGGFCPSLRSLAIGLNVNNE